MPEAAMDESKQDFLEAMFHMQAELNRRIGVDTTALPEEEQPKWVLNYCRAMSQETAELIDSVPWKWWAKYQTYDKQNARIEVVDLFHFLISLAQVVGLSAQDVHDLYMKKNKLNFQRQDSGYTVKDSGDNKDLKV
jgi:dimeric dUTPase (all-alpha-NTP-PPase superfamily)